MQVIHNSTYINKAEITAIVVVTIAPWPISSGLTEVVLITTTANMPACVEPPLRIRNSPVCATCVNTPFNNF